MAQIDGGRWVNIGDLGKDGQAPVYIQLHHPISMGEAGSARVRTFQIEPMMDRPR